MTIRTRTAQRMKARLEGLEAREAPAVGLAGTWQAAAAHSWGGVMRGEGPQGLQRELSSPRPNFTHQTLEIHRDGAPYANRGPIAPPSTLPWAPGAPVYPTTPAFKAPVINRAWLRPAWTVHSTMRAPTTLHSPTTPATPVTNPPTTPVTPVTPSNPPNDITNANTGTPAQSLPPNVSGVLNALYQEYQRTTTVPVSEGPGTVIVSGDDVGVSVHGNGQGSFATLVSTLQNLGMQINASSDVTWTIDGMLPISQLPAAAQTPQTLSITPMYRPVFQGGGFGGAMPR